LIELSIVSHECACGLENLKLLYLIVPGIITNKYGPHYTFIRPVSDAKPDFIKLVIR